MGWDVLRSHRPAHHIGIFLFQELLKPGKLRFVPAAVAGIEKAAADVIHFARPAVPGTKAQFAEAGGIGHKVRASRRDNTTQQRGLVFPVRLRLVSNQLLVDGRTAPLSPGMMASAEIVTGTRRVIEYLWSPVARSLREAGRER